MIYLSQVMQNLIQGPKKMKVIPAHVHHSGKFREAFGTLQ